MMNVEICLEVGEHLSQEVEAAFLGGASTIELCSDMKQDGLTPATDAIRLARAGFRDRPGLMVMVRPRGGNFEYTSAEIDDMLGQMETAGNGSADGVVFGALTKSRDIHTDHLQELATSAKGLNLISTFHRAFDATPNPIESVNVLIEHGIDRVLTSGVPWGDPGTALQGATILRHTITAAAGRIEIVVSGGISPSTIGPIFKTFPDHPAPVSFHAYSGAKEEGLTTVKAVSDLVRLAQSI